MAEKQSVEISFQPGLHECVRQIVKAVEKANQVKKEVALIEAATELYKARIIDRPLTFKDAYKIVKDVVEGYDAADL